jgi:hypothetical protein
MAPKSPIAQLNTPMGGHNRYVTRSVTICSVSLSPCVGWNESEVDQRENGKQGGENAPSWSRNMILIIMPCLITQWIPYVHKALEISAIAPR